MTKLPTQGNETSSESDSVTGRGWRHRVFYGVLLGLLTTTSGGLIYGWYYLNHKLVPLIEKEVSQSLNRPIKIGKLQQFSLSGGKFGKSQLPKTSKDNDWLVAEAVKVNFSLQDAIWQKKLPLNITLIKPEIYIERDLDKDWVKLELNHKDKQPGADGFKVEVKRIAIQKGDLTIVSRDEEKKLQPPVEINLNSAIVDILDDGDRLSFKLKGKSAKDGNLSVVGQAWLPTEEINLRVRGKNIEGKDISNLLALPLDFTKGKAGGNLEVKLGKEKPTEINGIASISDATLVIPQLMQPFTAGEGKLIFQGTTIGLDKVKTNFGKIPALITGKLDVEGDYQLQATTQAREIREIIETLKLTQPNIPLQGKVKGEIEVVGALDDPTVNISAATLGNSLVDKIPLRQIKAKLQYHQESLRVSSFTGLPFSGGLVKGKGWIDLGEKGNLVFDVVGENISGNSLAKNYNVSLPVDMPSVTGKAKLISPLDDLSQLQLREGEASFALGGGKVFLQDLFAAKGKWQAKLKSNNIQLDSLPLDPQTNPAIKQGKLDGFFNLAGKLNEISLEKISATGKANVRLADGNASTENLTLVAGKWQGDLVFRGINLEKLLPDIPANLQGIVAGKAKVNGNVENLSLDKISAFGIATMPLGGGKVTAKNLQLVNGNWQTNLQINNVKLASFYPESPPEWNGFVNGNFLAKGNIDNFALSAIAAIGNGSLTVAQGRFIAQNLRLDKGNFTTTVLPQNIVLEDLFADEQGGYSFFTGKLGGKLDVVGNVNNLSLPAIKAQGDLIFQQGISLVDRKVKAQINWNGKRLNILQATAEGFQAKGYLDIAAAFFTSEGSNLENITAWQLDISQAKNLNLANLPIPLSPPLAELMQSKTLGGILQGKADFTGKIAGNIVSPLVAGNLTLTNLAADGIDFTEVLTGKIDLNPSKGLNLALTGNTEQINLQLSPTYKPESFLVVRDKTQILQGKAVGDILNIQTQNLPLSLIKEFAIRRKLAIADNLKKQNIQGDLSGNFSVNWQNNELIANNLRISNPILGRIKGDSLTGNLRYQKQMFVWQDITLQQGDSIYQANGSLWFKASQPQFTAAIKVIQGDIQAVLTTLEFFDISDFAKGLKARKYAKAADLYTQPIQPHQTKPPLFEINDQNLRLDERLDKFTKIKEWLAKNRQEEQETDAIPQLSQLQGKFTGNLTISQTNQPGIQARFDFQGNNWQWGSWQANNIIAQGELQDGILTLRPIAIKHNESSVSFTGSWGGDNQSGQIRLKQVPVELINNLVTLPAGRISVGGKADATITIAGTQANPQAKGALKITNGTINETPIVSTTGSFDYSNARFNFFIDSIINPNSQNPLTISGSIPYKLPFASLIPEDDSLNLQLNIENEGLVLLDILSRQQVRWRGGTGKIALDIFGKMNLTTGSPEKLRAKGNINLENAIVSAKILPEDSLTQINSQINFDLDRIEVENFTANLSGGKVSITGMLPIAVPQSQTNPLTIALENLTLELENLYQGEIDGNIQVTGAVVGPNLSGIISLSQGTIFLPSNQTDNPSESNNEFSYNQNLIAGQKAQGVNNWRNKAKEKTKKSKPTNPLSSVQFSGLIIELDKNINIVQPPILDFIATGSLNLYGSLASPEPEGIIRLKKGSVNLFTTQFNLAGGKTNTAKFTRESGLDPYLEIELVASAVETRRIPIAIDPVLGDVPDTSTLGESNTIRIQAKIAGKSSQLTENLKLTSSPPRSEAEIIALLGGNLIDVIGNSNSTTLGLANLAGSALFSNFNTPISRALGLSEFRIFTTQIIDEKRQRDTILALAAEASIDLTDDLSFSILKILNNDVPAELSLDYRVNDYLIIRGTSNFDDESRFIIQYEQKF